MKPSPRNASASANGRHPPPAPEAIAAAKEAGLRYVGADHPGIGREKSGRDFRFRGPDGKLIADRATLARIRRLAIPPAWTEVWICPFANGHLQATGRDARQRKQYRYHEHWRETRDENKYERMIAFGRALPGIRRRVAESDHSRVAASAGKKCSRRWSACSRPL